jgi:hypothetical protein
VKVAGSPCVTVSGQETTTFGHWRARVAGAPPRGSAASEASVIAGTSLFIFLRDGVGTCAPTPYKRGVLSHAAVPQLPQNFTPGGRGLLQLLQAFGSTDWPQLLQNFEPAGTCAWQFGHSTPAAC